MATTVTTTYVTPSHDNPAAAAHGQPVHRAHDGAAHVHGSMSTQAHERSFEGFVRFLTWNVVGIVLVLIFLALANS